MFGVCHDLDQLHKRLTQWIGARVALTDMTEDDKRGQETVVEGNLARVCRLPLPPGKARWMGTIPDPHDSSESRHWFIRKALKHQTLLEDETADGPCSLPPELTFWAPTDAARSLLLLARQDLNALFSTEQARSPAARILYTENVFDGTYALFGADSEFNVLYKDAMRLVSRRYRGLARLCHEYASMACAMYGLSMQEFAQTARICITRYSEGGGEPLSLLPFARFDRGPVLCVILGEKETCLDTSLVLAHENPKPARIHLRDGTLIAIDGHARLMGAFGMPAEACTRYRLTFYLAMDRSLVLDYSTDLCAPVLYTPMRRANVVTSHQFANTHGLNPVYHAACETAVHRLQELVLTLESHACVEGKYDDFQRAHHR